jgi:hypothetical protein
MLDTYRHQEDLGNNDKAHALAFNLFLLSSVFWSLCALFWLAMLVTLSSTTHKTKTDASPDARRISSP